MTRPLVSIVTPTYNQEAYLGQCIESVLSQTYSHWEQIIVDDGSTDATDGLVRRYTDARVRYIRLPHRGLSALADTYNGALAAARGDIIAILEGDDLWPVDKLEVGLRPFSNQRVLLVWGRAKLIDEAGQVIGERTSIRGGAGSQTFSSREIYARLTRRNVLTPTITVMLRRDALDRAGGFTQGGSSLYVDLPTWLRVLAISDGDVCFVNHVLGFYRVHASQTTQRHRRGMAADHLSAVLDLEREVDPRALRAVGWDAEMRRRAIVAGHLGAGMAELESGCYGAAKACFASAWTTASGAADRAKAALGIASALSRVDLFGATLRARDAVLEAVDQSARK